MRERRHRKSVRKKTKESWPIAYRWLAAGTLAVYTAVGSQTITVAYGQEREGATQVVQSIRRFDIPAGRLEVVLHAFTTQTRVTFELQKIELGGLPSPGVSGVYSIEDALQRLLKDSGVGYRFLAPGAVRLELRGPNASVEVSERIAPSSRKYTEPLVNIPQTITLIPRKLIEEQGATTLRDVLRNVSGLTMTAGEGGAPAGDNLTLRGFSARNDVFVDGVRDLGPQSRDPFNLEQVEVVKGPSSAFAGRGSTGGSINLVSKAPGLARALSGTFNFGSDGVRRATLDANTPIALLGERAAFRLNAVGHESGVPGRDIVENRRWGFAPSLSFGLGTPTRLTLGYFRMKQDNMPDYGIPWVPATNNVLSAYRDQPAPVPRDSFYGLKARDHEKTGSDLATATLERDFSDNLSLRSQLRYGRSTRDSITTSPRFASNDSLVINRNGPSWLTEDRIWDNQTDLNARFAKGGLEHSVAAGVNITHEGNIRNGRTVTGTPTTTLYNPDPNQAFSGSITRNPIVGDLTANSHALYAFDTIKLSGRWQLSGGLRWDRFQVQGTNTTGERVARVDRMPSLRGAILFKPAARGSVYASYGTSMNPSLEGLSYQPANTTLEPEKTYTVEAGSKWDVYGDRLTLSGAVFNVTKTNARTPGIAIDDPPQVLEGEQRVNGIELGATGKVTRNWNIFGAYTYLDSKISRSNVSTEVGKRLINTPANSFNIWTTHRLGKLELGGGARMAGGRYGNTTNTRRVGSYWTADAMASYPLTPYIDLRLNLYNLNNAFYFDRLGGGHLIPGSARSAMLGARFRF